MLSDNQRKVSVYFQKANECYVNAEIMHLSFSTVFRCLLASSALLWLAVVPS